MKKQLYLGDIKEENKVPEENILTMVKNNIAELEERLWDVADELRANSELKSSEYSAPVLGLIFLRYVDYQFTRQKKILSGELSNRRKIGKIDYQAAGVLYLPDKARFSYLLNLPEGVNIGKAINEAMEAIERENEDLKGVLPKTYNKFKNDLLSELLKLLSSIPEDIEGDTFGKIYEYFLGKFAMNEGSRGGEFFTPTSIVKLIVAIIQPFHGKIFDPACGSGGMFVQSAEFVDEHKKKAIDEISIYGQEKTKETVNLCKMNLAVHGLSGDIKQGNSYYDDLHDMVGKFDFVMANPPFNVNRVDKDRIKNDRRRFPFGIPSVDNANYIWIQIFYSALNERGRAGFVMANSASDARASELELRKKLIQSNSIDVIIAVGSNFFYTVTLPCTLWFIDMAKTKLPPCQPSPPAPLPEGEGSKNNQYRGGYDFSGLVEKAREMRKAQTPPEKLLWELLRNKQLGGLKFRRQHQIGDYIVDFYCHEKRLIIELDGCIHQKVKQVIKDKKRDEYLRALGINVLRFKNEDVINNIAQVLSSIAEQVFSSFLPSPSGRGKGEGEQHRVRGSDTVLFIDARNIYTQIDRAHREFSPEQIEFISDIVHLYRGESIETTYGSEKMIRETFPEGKYQDVTGLCKVATLREIEEQGWSLNPGRYVGVVEEKGDDGDFKERLEELNEELEKLNTEARELEKQIAENVAKIMGRK